MAAGACKGRSSRSRRHVRREAGEAGGLCFDFFGRLLASSSYFRCVLQKATEYILSPAQNLLSWLFIGAQKQKTVRGPSQAGIILACQPDDLLQASAYPTEGKSEEQLCISSPPPTGPYSPEHRPLHADQLSTYLHTAHSFASNSHALILPSRRRVHSILPNCGQNHSPVSSFISP